MLYSQSTLRGSSNAVCPSVRFCAVPMNKYFPFESHFLRMGVKMYPDNKIKHANGFTKKKNAEMGKDDLTLEQTIFCLKWSFCLITTKLCETVLMTYQDFISQNSFKICQNISFLQSPWKDLCKNKNILCVHTRNFSRAHKFFACSRVTISGLRIL